MYRVVYGWWYQLCVQGSPCTADYVASHEIFAFVHSIQAFEEFNSAEQSCVVQGL